MRGFAGWRVGWGTAKRPGAGAPRPLAALLPGLASAAFVLGVGLEAGIAWPWVTSIVCLLVSVAASQAVRVTVDRHRRRLAADRRLLSEMRSSASLAFGWRARELTTARRRRRLARNLQHIEREVCGEALPGPLPLNKRAIRAHLALLRALRERLEDRNRPVTARGVLLVERLLRERRSPLHAYLPAEVLAEALRAALAAVDNAEAPIRSRVTVVR